MCHFGFIIFISRILYFISIFLIMLVVELCNVDMHVVS